MEKIKFECKSNGELATVETEIAYLPDICDAFKRFLIASGFGYVTYKSLAKTFRDLHDERG